MMQIPPQNIKVEHWITNIDPAQPFTPGLTLDMRLVDVSLKAHNGYIVVRYHYEVIR